MLLSSRLIIRNTSLTTAQRIVARSMTGKPLNSSPDKSVQKPAGADANEATLVKAAKTSTRSRKRKTHPPAAFVVTTSPNRKLAAKTARDTSTLPPADHGHLHAQNDLLADGGSAAPVSKSFGEKITANNKATKKKGRASGCCGQISANTADIVAQVRKKRRRRKLDKIIEARSATVAPDSDRCIAPVDTSASKETTRGSKVTTAERPPLAPNDVSESNVEPEKSRPPAETAKVTNWVPPEYSRESSRIRKLIKKHRRWIETPFVAKFRLSSVPSHTFTFSTFNVLAQDLLNGNPHLYDHCPKKVLDWDYRKAAILTEISLAGSDIICLQEVQERHFEDFFKPELSKMGYKATFKCRTGDKSDGCAIFWAARHFKVVSTRNVEFRCTGDPLMDRDNVAVIVTLKSKRGKMFPCLHVATTHLLFNPRRGDIKLAQLRTLLAELDDIAYRPCSVSNPAQPPPDVTSGYYEPIILCGDFNCTPFSPMGAFLRDGFLDYSQLTSGDLSGQCDGVGAGRAINIHRNSLLSTGQYRDVIVKRFGETSVIPYLSTPNHAACSHPFRLMSTYMHTKDSSLEVTTHHKKASCTVDYIYYQITPALVHLASLSLLNEVQLQALKGLPNAYLGSDHFSLVARFALRQLS